MKREERSEECGREKGKRSVKLTGKTENKRKTAADFRAESKPLVGPQLQGEDELARLASRLGAAVLPPPCRRGGE